MENAELLHSIYDTAADAIITVDDQGVILFCNQSTGRIFDYEADELPGKNVGLFIPPKYLGEYQKLLNECHQSGNIQLGKTGRRLSAQKRDGTIFPVSLTFSNVNIKNQNVFIGIVREITAITHVEEALVQHADELNRSNLELEQFAYMASHDLQAPLRVIAHYTGSILERHLTLLNQNAQDSMRLILKSTKRMQALINGLLLISRVESHVVARSVISIKTALDLALQNLELNMNESRAKITHSALPSVRADEGLIVQLFQNLIGNAIKFRSDADPEVQVSARSENGKWIFSVEDNGIGIPSQYLEKIFGIFCRLQSRADYPGSGIGLSLCKKIVERHGGTIWVESTPGKGTKFSFTLGDGGETST